MALRVSGIIVVAAVIAGTLSGPPVRIDEQHLHVPQRQGSGNGWQDSVPGLPGKDYPNLSSIPKTSFSCAGKTPGGYYADVETRCQVFHVCNTEGTKSSFLCPSGSIFNQRHFVCDWWYDFECEKAPELYSLNDALDDHESTADQSEVDQHSPGDPLPYNSIGASNNDLSLASSGYPNNIRDEANLIYEDYASGKISVEADGNLISEKPTSGASVDSTGIYVGGAGASGLPSSDNYSVYPERLNTRDQHQSTVYQRTTSDIQSRRSDENRDYRGRPSRLHDNVPRGFSSSRAEEPKRNDNGPGFFVNNGLFEGRDKNQDKPTASLREDVHSVDNQNINESIKNKEKISASENNANNVRYGIYYKNPEKYPLPQENNNYANSNSKEMKQNGNYNKNEINSNYQNSSNESSESYYVNSEMRSGIKYGSNLDKSESTDSSSRDFTGEPYNRILEYGATTSRAVSSAPTEDEVDREWQRAVDSTELKRNSAQRSSYDYESSASFLVREETGHPWREDLTTSSSGSLSPPYPTDVSEGAYSNYETSPAPRPEISTISIEKEQPRFLGRRPTGGLLSGAGNGLPGANKLLVGSVSITGQPGENTESTDGPPGDEAWDSSTSYPSRNERNKIAEFQPYRNKQDIDYGALH